MIELLAHLAVIALFLGLAALFSRGKGAFLIAGYNTAPRAKKAKYDEKALCRFMGRLMLAMAACWVPVALGTLLEAGWLYGAGIAAYLIVIAGGVIWANTGGRFRKGQKGEGNGQA